MGIADALLLGLLSASSLLLGAGLARTWRPPSWLLGVLMAFGGGALLSALTIELAGPAVEHGHVAPLVVGCVLGGLLFVGLEHLIHQRGGFLRKTSTTLSYVRRQERRRLRDLLRSLGRIDVFEGQPDHVLTELADGLVAATYAPGATIYRRHDPCHNLYVVAEGEVDLVRADPGEPHVHVGRGSAFGYLAFFGGTRHTVTAVARTPVKLWRLPRTEFIHGVRGSVALSRSYERWVESPEAQEYFGSVWSMDAEARSGWSRQLIESIHKHGEMPSLSVASDERGGELKGLLGGFPQLADLPNDELELLAEHLILKSHDQGHAFFHRGEAADRIYFLVDGRVAMVHGSPRERDAEELTPGRMFGAYSFLARGHHTATAVAASDVQVAVLRRRDLDTILGRCPHLKDMIEGLLRESKMDHYLRHRQGLDRDRATQWVRRALQNLRAGRLLPSVESMMSEVHRPEGAPVAIWLGILLDGIPESLVIGTSLVGAVSPSAALALVVGLFISNFPESLSSSVGMMEQGISFRRVLLMWGLIVLVTGVGAMAGFGLLVDAPAWVFALIEGIAAGAMLTMIAETMLPEAFARGGHLTGLATLLGFLTAIVVSAVTG